MSNFTLISASRDQNGGRGSLRNTSFVPRSPELTFHSEAGLSQYPRWLTDFLENFKYIGLILVRNPMVFLMHYAFLLLSSPLVSVFH